VDLTVSDGIWNFVFLGFVVVIGHVQLSLLIMEGPTGA